MPFLSTFWDAIWFLFTIFVFVAYLIAIFSIISDLFRDRELGGVAKAIWLVALVFLPFLTALAYLILRGSGMSERAAAQAQKSRELSEDYLRSLVATSPTDEIARAKELHDSGAITPEEYDRLKSAALAKVGG